MKNQRKKIWIDAFQTKLSIRIASYFALYQAAVWAIFAIERHLSDNMQAIFGNEAPGVSVFLTGIVVMLGVLFIYDAIQFTHRIVGPVYRFRKTVQAVTNGEELQLIHLRHGDFLQDMKDDVNEMLLYLEERGAITIHKRDTLPLPKPSVKVADKAAR